MKFNAHNYLKINHYDIYNSKVKEDIKISGISDIHISEIVTESQTEALADQIYKQKPDYICIVGDIVDSAKELENEKKRNQTTKLAKDLGTIAPTMVLLASHDYMNEENHQVEYSYNDEYWSMIGNLNNVYLLKNKIYQDDRILFMGYFQSAEYYYDKTNPKKENVELFYQELLKYPELYEEIKDDIPTIGLIHSPDFATHDGILNLLNKYDLIMSGHYHNGCVPVILDDIVKGNRGIISPKKELLPHNARGLVELKTGTKLIINGGVEKIQDCAPKILQPLNNLCYQQMDTLTLTSDQELINYQVKSEKVYTKK